MLREIQADFDRIAAQIKSASEAPEDVSGDVTNMVYEYICVAITGRLEQNVKTIFVTYANRKSDPRLGKSISRLCQSFQNPSKDKLLDLISLFDGDYSNRLRVMWKEEGSIGNNLSDLVGKRKMIAHQTSNNRDVTKTKIDTFYRTYRDVITELSDHFLDE